MYLLDSEESQTRLIESLIDPRAPCSGRCQRARSSPTKIKILYHLFQLHKNIESGRWKENFQSKTRIAKSAGVGKKHFSEFVNSSDFALFGEVIHRYGTTNIYRLKKWVIDIFYFLEKKGMMKEFRNSFEKWKKTFLERVDKWLIPLLQKGVTFVNILMNKLSTKKPLKGGDLNLLKGVGIKPSVYIKPKGIKTIVEDDALHPMQCVDVILSERLSFSISDRRQLFLKNAGWVLKKATSQLLYRIDSLGWKPDSNIRALQSIINEQTRKGKYSRAVF